MSNFDKLHEMAEKLRQKIQAFPDRPKENPEPVDRQKQKGALMNGLSQMTRIECEAMRDQLKEEDPELSAICETFIKEQWK